MIRVVRYCKTCHTKGKVVESRENAGLIVRRLKCENGHRFTTIELQPAVAGERANLNALRAIAS